MSFSQIVLFKFFMEGHNCFFRQSLALSN